MKKMLLAQGSSVIIGTVIGAGILGLPFAFVQSGFLTGLLVLALVGACIIILSLFFGEVTLRTTGNHQLTGYTEKYLGKTAKHLQALLILFGMYSALLAYTIGLGEIFSNFFGGTNLLWSLLSYIALSLLVIKGLGIIKRVEFVIGLMILGLLFTLALIATPYMDTSLWPAFDMHKFFIPYGAILFACSGIVSVPEAKQVLAAAKGEKLLKAAILIGNSVPIFIYGIFTAIIVAVTGNQTTEIATIGLSSTIGAGALIVGSLFSLTAMTSSFMTLGTAIKDIYSFDYFIPKPIAIILTLGVPLALFVIGFRDFFGIVSTAGALSVGLTGLLSLATFWRARSRGNRKPEYIIPSWFAVPASVLIASMCIAGLIYTL